MRGFTLSTNHFFAKIARGACPEPQPVFQLRGQMSSHCTGEKLARLSTGVPVPLDTPAGKDYTSTVPKRLYLLTYLKLSITVFSRR